MVLNTFFLFFEEKRTYIPKPQSTHSNHLTSPHLPSQPPRSLLTSYPPTCHLLAHPSPYLIANIHPYLLLHLLHYYSYSPLTTHVTTHDLSPFQSIHLFSPSYPYYITLQSPCQHTTYIINKILTNTNITSIH